MNYDDMTLNQKSIVYHQAELNKAMFWYLVPEARRTRESEECVKADSFANAIENRTMIAILEQADEGEEIFSKVYSDSIRTAIRDMYDMYDDIMTMTEKEWDDKTEADIRKIYTERWNKFKVKNHAGTATVMDKVLYSYLNIFVNALWEG